MPAHRMASNLESRFEAVTSPISSAWPPANVTVRNPPPPSSSFPVESCTASRGTMRFSASRTVTSRGCAFKGDVGHSIDPVRSRSSIGSLSRSNTAPSSLSGSIAGA